MPAIPTTPPAAARDRSGRRGSRPCSQHVGYGETDGPRAKCAIGLVQSDCASACSAPAGRPTVHTPPHAPHTCLYQRSTTHGLETRGDDDAVIARVARGALFEHGRWVVAVAAERLATEAASVRGQLRLHLGLVRRASGRARGRAACRASASTPSSRARSR
eukprot:4739448-Prymnesium_polylepis.1